MSEHFQDRFAVPVERKVIRVDHIAQGILIQELAEHSLDLVVGKRLVKGAGMIADLELVAEDRLPSLLIAPEPSRRKIVGLDGLIRSLGRGVP